MVLKITGTSYKNLFSEIIYLVIMKSLMYCYIKSFYIL